MSISVQEALELRKKKNQQTNIRSKSVKDALSARQKRISNNVPATVPTKSMYGISPISSFMPIRTSSVIGTKRNTSVSPADTEAVLPRTDNAVQNEEFGGVVNEVGGELIVRSFNKFLEDQYKIISEIDSTADGMDKNISYRNALKDAAEKIGMYRRTFSNSEKVLDSVAAAEGLELLSRLEEDYRDRMKSSSLPKEYFDAEKAGSATPAADYIRNTRGEGATKQQLAAVMDMYEGEVARGHDPYAEYDVDAAKAELKKQETIAKSYGAHADKIKALETKLLQADAMPGVIDKSSVEAELAQLYAEREKSYMTSSQLAQMRVQLREAEMFQKLMEYQKLQNNDDFSEKSRPRTEYATDEVYAYINNIKPDNWQDAMSVAIDRSNSGVPTAIIEHYDELTEDEILLYNYIYNEMGATEADSYLDTLGQEIQNRYAQTLKNNKINPYLLGLVAGLSNPVEALEAMVDPDSAHIQSGLQMAASESSKDLGVVGKTLYNVIYTTANMAPSLAIGGAVGLVNPAAGAWVSSGLMGLGAGGNAYAEAKREGYTDGEAAFYGVLTGASEALLEKFLGGVIPTGKFGSFIKGLDKAALRVAATVGESALSEFTEEGLQSVLEQTVIRNIALGDGKDFDDIDWGEVLYSGLIGAIIGGGSGVVEGGSTEIGNYKLGHGVDGEALAEVVNKLREENGGKPVSGTIGFGGFSGTMNKGNLASQAIEETAALNRDSLISTLEDAGYTERESSAYADELLRVYEGGEFSDGFADMLDPESENFNETIFDIAMQTVYDSESDVSKRAANLAKIFKRNHTGTAEQTGRQYSFGGAKARTADLSALEEAKSRITLGEDPETVRRDTGWFKGYDGEWRFEIDDSSAVFRPEGDVSLMKDESYIRLQELTDKWAADELTDAEYEEMEWLEDQFSDRVWEEKYRLDDYLDHPALYEAYPMLRFTSLVFDDLPIGERGYFNPRSNTIVLSRDLFGKQKNTLLHEIQHVIQKYEGFAKGSSPEYWSQLPSEQKPKPYDSAIRERKKIADKIMQSASQEFVQAWRAYNRDEIEFLDVYENPEFTQAEKEMFWDYVDWHQKALDLRGKDKSDVELYEATAGEIEARDTASRANYTPEQRKNTRPDIDRTDVVFADKGTVAKAFVGWTADGNEVYSTSSSVMGMSETDRIAKFKKDFLANFRGRTAKFTRNGHTHYARFVETSQGLGKFAYEGNSPKSKSSTSGIKAKIRMLADGNMFELVEDSKYERTLPETGKQTKAHKKAQYWDYYTKTIVVDGKGYDVVINVRLDAPNGDFSKKAEYVYSITFIDNKNVSTSVSELATSKDESYFEAPTGDSIPQKDGSVNTHYYSSPVASAVERVLETRRSAEANGISNEDISVFEKVAEEFGVSVRFYTADPTVEGDGFYEDGTIYLNTNAIDPIDVVFSHELSHHAERSGFYNSYKTLALRELQKNTGSDLDTLIAEVTERYQRYGIELDRKGAEAELVARFTQEYILGGSEELVRICNENVSLMQRVLDFFADFLEKIGVVNEDTRRIDRARRRLVEALRDVGSGNGDRNVQYKTTDVNNTTAEKLSYQNLINKPDMSLCEIDDVVSVKKPTSQMRKDAINEAIDNACEIGITDENGGVSVYVEDIGSNIILSKKGLKHGLDSRFSENLPATLKAGEILSNAIKINELLPQNDSANKTFVLLGAAKSKSGDLSLVRFVVNSYTGEVDSINVLYALTTKKESAVLNAPRLTGNPLSITDSKISISQLLDYVNKYFPDILPESVLKHYGHASRPDGVLGKSALYSFSRSAGSLDADMVARAEQMEADGATEDEIYDAVGLWRDSETGRWTMDNDTAEIERYRGELEVNDGRRNGTVADPVVFGEAIAEAEQMEADGKKAAEIWDELGLWRNRRTGEWMTYDTEPRYAPFAGKLSDAELASRGFRNDEVDVYRDAVEEARRASEERAVGSEDEALSIAEQERKEISRARGDIALDGIEYSVQEAISEEFETEMYDIAEALTEAEEARIEAEYILAEASGKQAAAVQDRNEAQFEAAEEARRAGEEYYFVRGNTGEITAEDEAFAYGPGEDLTEGVFNAIMEADTERRDSALTSITSKSETTIRNDKFGAKDFEDLKGQFEAEAAKRDIATRTILRIVDDNGIIASRTDTIAKYAGQIARGLYPMSRDTQKIYHMLVDQDRTDGSFANDIELYEERIERAKADLESMEKHRGSEADEMISEVQERIARYEKKLQELRSERERFWKKSEESILDYVEDIGEVDLDEPYMYDWYLDSKNTALGDARFWFEYGAPAKELALNILAATDSLTEKTEREAIASKIAFLNREIKKQESRMDEGSIMAAEKLAVEGYIESDSDDVHYLADLYRSLRAMSAGEYSTALRNLSVMIDKPITSKYGTAAEFRMSAVRRDRLEREARRMGHKLTSGEKKIAKDIAEGNRLPSEIPQEFDSAKIMRFANLWKAYQSEISQSKNIQKFRARTAEEYRNTIKEMIGEKSIMKIGRFGTPKLNLLTPERAMRYAFGDTLGSKLADELIYPIHRNEAERIRFINRLLKDFDSRFGKISKFESGHVQRLGEYGATLELYDNGEIEARNRGYGYWEYAGMRRNEFKDVSAELLHRETLGHMERLNHDSISDSFWDALEKDLADTYTKELIDTRTAELKEKARVKHKETPEKISNGDMKKLTDGAWERAKDEVSQLRDNEATYKSGDFSAKDIKELRKMVEETSPEDVLWNIKTELDEYAAKHIRKGDNSAEAQAERDSFVDREIRRRLMISDHMRQMYNMLFDGINDMLVSHGYDPVPFRRNYFPHIQPENTGVVSKLLSSFGFHPEVTALPAQLAGRTEVFKPGHRWAPFMQRRVGNTTDFDAVKGFEGYLNYASDIIYHMDDIQKLRGFSTLIRTENSTEEIKTQIGRLQDDFLSGKITRQELDEKREELLNKAKLTGDAGKFVTWLDDYTNVLAGKQAAFDRGIEHLLGRTALNAGQALQTTYTRSAVLGNLSSALMNFSQLPMGIAIAGPKNMLRAMDDMVSGRLNVLYNFDERSDFLTGKKGVIKISQKGKMEAYQDFLGGLFSATDDIAVRLMQRALFYELVDSGMTIDEAIIRSDRLCQAIMASRTKGAKPIAFESKNFFIRNVTTFQLEIENSLSFVHEDLTHEMKEIHGENWKGKLARTIISYLFAAWLMNMGFEEWLGKSPAPIDIIGIVLNTVASMFGSSQREIVHNIMHGIGSSDDLEFKGAEGILDAFTAFGKETADDLPFISSVGQMLGVTEGRMPMLDFSPIWEDIGPGIYSAMLPEGATEEERDQSRKEGLMDAGMGAIEIVKGIWPGGSQIYKTGMGITSLVRGGVYDNRGNLKYPIERNSKTITQGILFGPNAMSATDEYYASGGRAYSEGETTLISDLEATGMTMSEACDIIDTLDGLGARDISDPNDDNYSFTGDGYADLNALLFNDDSDPDKPTAAEEAIDALRGLGLTPEQEYLIYREKIASKKEAVLLDTIDHTGGDTVGVAAVLGDIRMAEGTDAKLDCLMDSPIDDTDAAMVFYGIIASKSERAAFDMLRDGQMEKSEDIFLTLSEQKRIENLTSDEVKAEGFEKKTAARYDALGKSPISESSKAVYYYEHMATENEKDALDELDKLGSDMNTVYSVVGDVRFAEDTGKKYGILIDSDITGDEQYAILKYVITSKDKRESLDEDIDDVIAAGGTVDDYLAAKEAVYGIKADIDRHGKVISGSKSKKMVKAIRRALPGTNYRLLVVLFELCGVSKSAY